MFQTGPTERETRIEVKLRPLRLVCSALAGVVGLCAVTTWMIVEGLGYRLSQEVPDLVPLSLTVFAMVLILLSSRLRTTILRRAFPRNPGVEIDLETFLSVYQQATLVSFVILTTAALLAILVALFSGTVFYGIFLCLAAAFAMSTRWPSLTDADRLARGRRAP